MRTRVSALPRARRYFLLAAIAAAGIFAAAPASAQVSQSSTAGVLDIETSPANLLRTVLDEGIRLETQDRWGEALAHYEEALREHPNDQSLLKRQDLAKLHYSLDRRYDDRSFRQSLAAMTPSQALGLYAELLRKVNAHYVDVPPWQRLGVRAVAALDVALQDPEFRSVHRLSADRGRTDALRSELYQLVGRRLFSGPSDLVTFSSEAGRLVEQRVGAPQTSTILEFVTAAAGGLDDYSAFLTADQLRDVYSQIEGNFVGLGVELKADSGALLIVHVIPGSPAERAGIRDGDRIVAVDGKSTAALSTDEAAALLTGEEGSVVQVTVASPGRQPRMATVRREHVEVPSLEDVEIADADFGVAYVRLPAFQKTTARDLEAALWDLHRQGMRSLVLDLRGNPGGLLTAAVEVADKFLMQGGIVSTRGRSAQEDFNYQAHYGGTWRVPLVVLIDGDSASASEIFAGAIKDNGRGDVVGERSFGKGSVQGIFPLGYAGAGVRLTTALFYSPLNRKISKQGVEPTVNVVTAARPVGGYAGLSNQTELTGDDDDPILEAGLEAARRQVAARTSR